MILDCIICERRHKKAAVRVHIFRHIWLLNLLFVLLFCLVWQRYGLCYSSLAIFSVWVSLIKNIQRLLNFPRRPVTIWLTHVPTSFVWLYQKISPCTWMFTLILVLSRGELIICGPLYLRYLQCLTWSQVQVSNPRLTNLLITSMLAFVVHTFHHLSCFPFLLPSSSARGRCHAGRRVRERRARNIHRIQSYVSHPRANRHL